MLLLRNGQVTVIPDHPEIGCKCELNLDRPVLGLRNRLALHALQEAVEHERFKESVRARKRKTVLKTLLVCVGVVFVVMWTYAR